jgi:hypothetical protein
VNGHGANRFPGTLYPRTFQLDAGKHTIEFHGREPNSRLGQLIITEDTRFSRGVDMEPPER